MDHKKTDAPSKSRESGPETGPPPVAAIVGSAGAFEAVREMLGAWDGNDKLAVVLMLHQKRDQSQNDLLASLLQEKGFEASTVEETAPLKAGALHVCPPGRSVRFRGKTLVVAGDDEKTDNMPLDVLLRTMARELGEACAAVVLSGANADSLLGAREVKEAGGLVLVQDPDTAQYATMPEAVIRDRLADHVAPVRDIPPLVMEYFRRRDGRPDFQEEVRNFPQDVLNNIFAMIKVRLGQDFSQYKRKTIVRRILRRMDLLHLEKPEEYLHKLRTNEDEPGQLFNDLLIGVTSFFRDPEAFKALREALRDKLLPRMGEREAFRAWVPACSTGEEAYSVAMAVKQEVEQAGLGLDLQLYATDLDGRALNVARKGRYPENVVRDVPPEMLRTWFVRREDAYAVRKELRENLVFAEHNLLKDPPFSRLDLICCRNLLIYLQKDAQQQVLSHFHYALLPHGLLFLGSSESLEQAGRYFESVDKAWRIFRKNGQMPLRLSSRAEHAGLPARTSPGKDKQCGAARKEGSVQRMAEQFILQTAPPAVLVNQDGDVLYIHGRTGRFLEPNQGEPKYNLMSMAREGLKADLSTIITLAASSRETRKRRRIPVKANGEDIVVDITAHFLKATDAGHAYLLVAFSESDPLAVTCSADEEGKMAPRDRRIQELEEEVESMRESMQRVVEEYQVANEELKSTNEELQSSNEELKSSNEELETAKEELQSINEEHLTLNSELQSKVDELHRVRSDLNNLMAATDTGALFLDKKFRIMRYTPAMRRIMNLQETDVDRPVEDINLRLKNVDIKAAAKNVLDDLETLTREVQTEQDEWLQMRILPYRSTEDGIEGVVVTFHDITQLKKSEMEARQARDLALAIIQSIRDPLAVLQEDMTVQSVNQAFADLFGMEKGDMSGESLLTLGDDRLESPELRRLLEEVIPQDSEVNDYPLDLPGSPGGRHVLNARKVVESENGLENMLIILQKAGPEQGRQYEGEREST
ncbi:MAG: CheR family methyltransferase [Desulfovibrionaceae bacterium]